MNFAGPGTANEAARSDHTHDERYDTQTVADGRFIRATDSAKTLWAFVLAYGTLGDGFGAVAVGHTAGSGIYGVFLNRDVTGFGLQATIVDVALRPQRITLSTGNAPTT